MHSRELYLSYTLKVWQLSTYLISTFYFIRKYLFYFITCIEICIRIETFPFEFLLETAEKILLHCWIYLFFCNKIFALRKRKKKCSNVEKLKLIKQLNILAGVKFQFPLNREMDRVFHKYWLLLILNKNFHNKFKYYVRNEKYMFDQKKPSKIKRVKNLRKIKNLNFNIVYLYQKKKKYTYILQQKFWPGLPAQLL